MTILRLFLAGGTTIGLYGVFKLCLELLAPYFSPLRDLPGPKSESFMWGNLGEIRTEEHIKMHEEWVKKYGKVIKYKGFINSDRLYTTDLRALNHILTHSADYQKPEMSRYLLSKLLGNGILITEAEKHRQQRRVLNPSFGPSSIRDLTPIFFQKALQLREIWKAQVFGQSGRIEVLSWLSRTTLDVIGLAGFNYRFESLNVEKEPNELSIAFSALFHSKKTIDVMQILQALFPIFRIIPTKREREEHRAKGTMQRIGRELLRQHTQVMLGEKMVIDKEVEKDTADMKGRDLLSVLVQANLDTEVPDSQKMSDEDVLAQIPTFLVAGHETTSTQTMWALYSLSQLPKVQQKLRDELLGVSTDTPSMDELDTLPYLDAVTRETLRIHAAVPVTVRVATKEDVIPVSIPFVDRKGQVRKEIRIREGETIFIPILAVNRDKDIWGEDAADFNPERWSKIPELASNIPGVWGNMLTFLGGARSCIGYRFAIIEMKALIFTLVRAFEFSMAISDDKFEKRSDVVTRPYIKDDQEAGAQMPLFVKVYDELCNLA